MTEFIDTNGRQTIINRNYIVKIVEHDGFSSIYLLDGVVHVNLTLKAIQEKLRG